MRREDKLVLMENHQVLNPLHLFLLVQEQMDPLVLTAREKNHFQSAKETLNHNQDQDKARELAELFQSVMVPTEHLNKTAGHLMVLYRDIQDNL